MSGKYILLAEDNPNDAELTLAALSDSHMVNPVEVVHDGAEALDFSAAGANTPPATRGIRP